MCTQKMRALSYIGAEKSRFTLDLTYRHTDRHTYIQTERQTDISVYRVASLLKRLLQYFQPPKHNSLLPPNVAEVVPNLL